MMPNLKLLFLWCTFLARRCLPPVWGVVVNPANVNVFSFSVAVFLALANSYLLLLVNHETTLLPAVNKGRQSHLSLFEERLMAVDTY